MERAELFSTSTTPYAGLKSARHPLTLRPGEASDAKNLRAEPGQPIHVREGIAKVLPSDGLPDGAEIYGASEPFQYGSLWRFLVAVRDPADSKIHVYYQAYDSLAGTWQAQWTKSSQPSGQFGDTRMTVPASGYVQFEWVRSPYDAIPKAVAVDGSLTARIWTPVGFAHANAIDPPEDVRSFPVQARMNDGLDVANGAATAAGGGANDWGTVQRGGSAGGYYWEWNTAASTSGTGAASIVHDTDDATWIPPLTDDQSKQIVLVAEYDDRSFWDCVKVDVRVDMGSGDSWLTVHDPANDLNTMVELSTNVAGYKVIAFSLPDRTDAKFVPSTTVTLDGIRLTSTSASLPATSNVKVHWVASSGRVPGGAEYACCRRQGASLVDSPGVIYQLGSFGREAVSARQLQSGFIDKTDESDFNVRSKGVVPLGASVSDAFVFPVDPRLFYVYDVPYSIPTEDNLKTNGADLFVIYRKEPGESEFYRVNHVVVGSYDAGAKSWVSVPGGNKWGEVSQFSDYVLPEFRTFTDRAPDEFTIPPQGGTAVAFANGRLHVAASVSQGSGNRLMISEQGQPMRFRELLRMDTPSLADPASGFAAKIEGENIRAIRAVSEQVQTPNGSAVLLFTDKSVYAVDRNVGGGAALFQLRKLNSLGCSAGASVAELDGNVVWLDKDMSARRLDGMAISLYQVDDRLRSVPSALLGRAAGIFHRGRYYLSRATASASRNDRTLVFNSLGSLWESDDTAPSGKEPQLWLEWPVGDRGLYFFASDGTLYQYEKPKQTTDDGAAIPFLVESGEFHGRSFGPVSARHVGLVGDTATTTLKTERLFSEPPSVAAGELDLDTGGSLAWKYDRRKAGGAPGGEGQAVRIRVSGEFTAAFRLLALVAEIEGAELGGAHG